MSQGYGPYTVTAGTIQPVGIDPNSTAVFIQNDSPYYLFVSFNPTQPSPSTILNLDWSASIKPFDSQTEYLVGDQLQTPQGAQTFQGKVWLLPVNLRNVSMAQAGTSSSAALVSVRSFLSGEQPPVAYSSSRQTDITSQTRVIGVPIVPQNFFFDVTVTGGQTLIPFGATVSAISPSQLNTAIYCYAVFAQQYNGSVAWTRWEIGWAQCDNSNTIYVKSKILSFTTTGSTASPPFSQFVFTPTQPMYTGISTPNPNATVLNLYITNLAQGSGATQSNLLLYLQMSADVRQPAGASGPGTPPPIGGGVNQVLNTNPNIIY